MAKVDRAAAVRSQHPADALPERPPRLAVAPTTPAPTTPAHDSTAHVEWAVATAAPAAPASPAPSPAAAPFGGVYGAPAPDVVAPAPPAHSAPAHAEGAHAPAAHVPVPTVRVRAVAVPTEDTYDANFSTRVQRSVKAAVGRAARILAAELDDPSITTTSITNAALIEYMEKRGLWPVPEKNTEKG